MGPVAQHVPVLLERSVELLAPAIGEPGAVVVDATVGLGGHSEALLRRFSGLHLIGLDRDPDALRAAEQRLAPFAARIDLVHTVYDDISAVLVDLGIEQVQGVLFDLGVSSMQLDTDGRGFSYARDAPLDMRMDPTRGRTAEDVVNEASAADLARIFRLYGEERLAARYADHIVAARERQRIVRSGELVAVLDAATPAALKHSGHPAKRVFQALRIEVNGELDALVRAMPAALDALAVTGRIVVLSYHSLEDRIVKRAIAPRTVSTAPRGLPIEPPEDAPTFRMLTRGAPTADAAEVGQNPRAASVRLRAAVRVRGNA
ncbi:16S rRNA (cytosine(1402)-N(4))-methyltransferase RsmH [uncultured Amnibacterium sp.]|uniref:16S rRNA (cytosine(1402)-N(4))-methyltransferase RsmH n=1 Tax=uncultured Amnibacterium sp. TaxID=1631851 RepID=UPI0035CAE055